MALDHAADGIRVNSVAPGPIASRYYDDMMRKAADPDAFMAGLRARSPMARLGQPAEIASMILYLASDESSFATGGMFTVDGGMTAW
jgi:NAD(P)-dependent dehydrogenase (short-subunit alcohol dehydrogenase family)